MQPLRFLGCATLLAGALALPAAAEAQESWFGGLFGSFNPAPAAPPSYHGSRGYDPGPLRVDVRPMRSTRRPVRAHVARVGRPPRISTIAAQTEAYARLNPANNPNWYLQDPTLRHGDIVVLQNGPMVFVGGRAAAHKVTDFQAPAQADDMSNDERARIEKIAVVNND
jgi:hypothetical protein